MRSPPTERWASPPFLVERWTCTVVSAATWTWDMGRAGESARRENSPASDFKSRRMSDERENWAWQISGRAVGRVDRRWGGDRHGIGDGALPKHLDSKGRSPRDELQGSGLGRAEPGSRAVGEELPPPIRWISAYRRAHQHPIWRSRPQPQADQSVGGGSAPRHLLQRVRVRDRFQSTPRPRLHAVGPASHWAGHQGEANR